MIFTLAALLDQTLASLNDPILAAFRVPHPEAFVRILWISLAATAAIAPWIVRHERARKTGSDDSFGWRGEVTSRS